MSGKYTKDVVMQAIARIISGCMSFLAVFVLTYLFDESQIGQYNLVLSTVNVITSIFTLWLSQGILRYYEEKKDLGFVLLSMMISGVLCVASCFIFNIVSNQNVSIHAYIYIFVLVFYYIFDALFRKQRKFVNYVILELLLSFSKFFPMVLIAYFTRDYNSVFISQYSIMFIYIIIYLIRDKLFAGFKFVYNKGLLKQYLKFGIPLLGLSVSNWFLTSSDRYIIKHYENDFSVGVYSTNYSLANSIYMMFALITVNAFHPIIVKAWDRDQNEGKAIVSQSLDYYLILVVPLVFYGCLKSSILLGMFKGNTYSEYNDVFIWTVLGIFVYGISLLYHKYYELIQNTNKILLYNLISAVTNIILNFILIPIYGFSIAAFTTFVSYVVYLIFVRVSTFNKFNVKFSVKKAIKILWFVLIFWIADKLLNLPSTLLVFFIEGFVYVVYTALMYQLFKVIDILGVLKKKKK